MFGSAVLEVAVGLIVCCGSIALIASSLQEAVASMLRWRASTLLQGIQDLLNRQLPLVLGIYNHALVNPRDNGAAKSIDELSSRVTPSYIKPMDFAQALVDKLRAGSVDPVAIRQTIASIDDQQLRDCLLGLFDRASGDVSRFESAVAQWFDGAMDRVSGAYKRKAQLWTFIFGLVIAIAFNIDAHQVMTTLWHAALVGHGLPAWSEPKDVGQALANINELPVGWGRLWALKEGKPDIFYETMAWALPGWIITATATLFGAPFWFSLLEKLDGIRGTGGKPS